MCDWAKSRGDQWLHLGGGGKSNQSLLCFNAGSSSDLPPFYTLRVVLDTSQHRRPVSIHGPVLDANDLTGFFPLYRYAT